MRKYTSKIDVFRESRYKHMANRKRRLYKFDSEVDICKEIDCVLVEHLKLQSETIFNRARHQEYVLARDILMSFLSEKYDLDYTVISKIARTNRYTVLAAFERIENYKTHNDIRQKIYNNTINFLHEVFND